jgi:hypothetical protein
VRTTHGKTQPRRPARKVAIWQGNEWICDRWASSLSQALREFARDRWGKSHHGVVVGNTLAVGDRIYTAKEKP